MQIFLAEPTSLISLVQTVIALIVIAVFVMAIATFVMAIWDFISSNGEEEKKERGWNRIRFMIIGIILVIVFLIILPLFLRWVGFIQYNLFTAPVIFSRVWEVLNAIFMFGGNVVNSSVEQGFSPQQINNTNSTSTQWYYTL